MLPKVTNTRWVKSTQFRWICLFTLDSTQEIYIPSDSQESSLQTNTHTPLLAFIDKYDVLTNQ